MIQILLFLLALFLLPMNSRQTDSFKAMTFNIRYGMANDGDNSWKFRKQIVFDQINKENCDFIGLQEAMVFQIDEIINHCPGYQYIGITREIDPTQGEASPILYDTAKWVLVNGKTQWLSENINVPGSKSWNTSLPRIFTWAEFQHKTEGNRIVIYNTHYDHRSADARKNSSKTIIQYMHDHHAASNKVLLGDLNALENKEPITYLTQNQILPLKDAYRELHHDSSDQDATFYGWKTPVLGEGRRIDYIFYSGNILPVSARVSHFNKNQKYPSDHLPVIVEFK